MLFVSIWATGFLVARLVAGHADPLTFLVIRFACGCAIFCMLAAAAGASWPRDWRTWRNAAITGLLLQGIYLAGVFWSVSHGLPAAVCALITGLQPLLTATLAGPMLGDQISRRQWTGIVGGLTGATMVLAPQVTSAVHAAAPVTVAAAGLATIAITLGTIWQKRSGGGTDLRVGAAIQFAASGIVLAPVAALVESMHFDGSWQAWTALGWSVLGLSVGGMTLLLMMIGRSAVAVVASLFYLVPPVVAVLAFLLFGEALSAVQIGGLLVASVGVAIATRNAR
jgi:drug/metabolite transporter (DMT)-like permease